MKVKYGVVYNAFETIGNLSNEKMPVKLAAKFLRLADEVAKEVQLIEQQKNDILKNYTDNKERNEKLQELSELEADLNFSGFSADELENSDLTISIAQYAVLRNFMQ